MCHYELTPAGIEGREGGRGRGEEGRGGEGEAGEGGGVGGRREGGMHPILM